MRLRSELGGERLAGWVSLREAVLGLIFKGRLASGALVAPGRTSLQGFGNGAITATVRPGRVESSRGTQNTHPINHSRPGGQGELLAFVSVSAWAGAGSSKG